MDDRKIIDLFLARDEDAIRHTANAYGRRLFTLANHILQNEQDAEENVNDTYMRSWDTIPPQRPKHFFAYLAKICRHFALDKLDWKSAAKRKAEVVSLTQEIESCIPDQRRGHELESRELGELLDTFLESLTPENRMVFMRREAYTNYPCYSQEMVDKVDELCIKYGLHLVGKPFFIPDAEGMAVHGLSGILKEAVMPRCFYGHLFQDGSFVAYGELDFSESYGKTVQFQMNSIKKDAFYTAQLGLNHISDILQWNYTTAEGYRALLALNGDTGFIFAENGGSFISIIIGEVPDANMVFTGLPKEQPFLEAVCDSFVFSDVENE